MTATSDRLADALTAQGAPFTADEVRAYVTRDGDLYVEDYVLAHLGEVLTAMSQEGDDE